MLLAAARKAFAESGDIGSTTIKDIAAVDGISEGLIYRYFSSKEELFAAAIVEPLQETIGRSIERMAGLSADAIVGGQARELNALNLRVMTSLLAEALPLLGLVMFSDPDEARSFFRTSLEPAIRKLGDAWTEWHASMGVEDYPGYAAATAVFGMCLMTAVELRHGKRRLALDERITELTDLLFGGFFPYSE